MKRTTFLRLAVVLLVTVLVAACSSDSASGPNAGGANFAAVKAILTDNCASCHGAASGRFFLVTMDSSELQQSGLVDPANPAQSLLALKATNMTPHGGGLIAGFTAANQALVNEWVAKLPPATPSLVEAIKVGSGTSIQPPTIDGFFDPVWDRVARVRLRVAEGWGEAEFVTVQAAYDATYLYMLVVWDDDKASTRRQPWVKQADGTWKVLDAKSPLPNPGVTWAQYKGAAFNEEDNTRFNYEDKLAIMWNTYGASTVAGFEQSGCTVMCHDPARSNGPGTTYNYTTQATAAKKYTNAAAEIADLWHWKLVRNNQHGKADDQFVRYWVPGPTGAADGGRASDVGAAGYASNPAVGGLPQYRGPSLTVPPYYIFDNQKVLLTVSELNSLPSGAEIPNMITSGPTGTRADVDAKGLYNSGTWGVEIRRKLVTNDVNDVQFTDLLRQYAFGVAIFDNAQIEHRYTPMVAKLVFKP
jgi:mono/diheme cytochrome c family protein